MELDGALKSLRKKIPWRPRLFDAKRDFAALRVFVGSGEVRHVIDTYDDQLKELFQIEKPRLVYDTSFSKLFKSYITNAAAKAGSLARLGSWVYYPWNATLVHILPDDEFQRVRTARNRNLITEKEQRTFYNARFGIGGQSVGNSVALALVLQGGARHIRLADFDTLALSNLNRVRAGVSSLGSLKVEMTARQIFDLDPYADVELFPDGLTDANIGAFLDGLDIVIDELDTIAMKLRLREEAAKRKIPVVMGADNGDNAVVDIERYDGKAQPPFFHGRLGDITVEELRKLDKFGIGRTITRHIGPENVTPRMRDSLLEMGKTIPSWPQLGGAALLNGVAVAYIARKILTSQPVESNRALISLDEKLVPGYNDPKEAKERSETAEAFKKLFKL